MSYNISLRTPDGGDHLEFDEPHQLQGGTYCYGGTTEAWLNITYNYSPHFRKVFGDKGIRSLYGLSAVESIPKLTAAIEGLLTDTDPDYWKSTAGNARNALINLLAIASQAVAEGKGGAKWDGD